MSVHQKSGKGFLFLPQPHHLEAGSLQSTQFQDWGWGWGEAVLGYTGGWCPDVVICFEPAPILGLILP